MIIPAGKTARRADHALTFGDHIAIISTHDRQGEMSEWFKEPVLKTGDAARHRGFESLSLRQFAAKGDPTEYGVEKYPRGCKGLPC